ncbi:AI-2E family transporter [Halorussus sp. MSC15.2]|uniref:AI-2E family transporter n=1 Tax=Halorussus sp. MSC15.2 TaxID=2283638 RepID=UPI0013D74EB6|nr:AI-2E family transporter [Halorussus sp. MSC15.2]NEU56020.1 AI-2E family transporter [Halorussus sp. MSC15.2]
MEFDWGLDRNQVAWGLLGVLVVSVLVIVVLELVGTLGFAVFLYYALRPAEERFEERFGDHPDVPPTLSLLLVGIPFLLIVGYTGLVAFREVCQVINSRQIQWAQQYLRPFTSGASCINIQGAARQLIGVPAGQGGPQAAGQGGAQATAGFTDTLRQYATLLFKILVRVFIVVVVAFYLLRDDEEIAGWFRKSFDYDDAVMDFTERVDRDLEHIFFGNLLTIVVTTVIAVAVYLALDMVVPAGDIARPILLGLATGVAVIIPIVGMKIVYVPYAVWLLIQATGKGSAMPVWFPVLYFAVTFVVVDTIPDFWIRSFLSAGRLTLGMIMLAYVLGTVVFGWSGLFIGPIVLTVGYHFADAVFPKLVAGHAV